MSGKPTANFDLDALVESQLNLQTQISYSDHHAFLIRNHLGDCAQVLDVGTGNGAFAGRLAKDHPTIQFVGIDKRKLCVENSKKLESGNFTAVQVDMFARESEFDFSKFDGFLMRYFLLHVDHSRKILELFKTKSRRPARFWIIDLDFSQFTCSPPSEAFDQLTKLVQEFCSKMSVDSMGGQRIVPMLKEFGYQNITVEGAPFSRRNVPVAELAQYLKQEVQCYSRMSGRSVHDAETAEIIRFIEEEFLSGRFDISYGMVLVYAELI